jgi:hypothetical protein
MSHSNIRDSSSTTDRFKLHPKAWRERLSPNCLISNHRKYSDDTFLRATPLLNRSNLFGAHE